jgi:hypothetical protein
MSDYLWGERRQVQGNHHDARPAEQAAPSLAERIASRPQLSEAAKALGV